MVQIIIPKKPLNQVNPKILKIMVQIMFFYRGFFVMYGLIKQSKGYKRGLNPIGVKRR